MGLHSSDDLDSRSQEGLVMVDLDANTVSIGKDLILLKCMAQPQLLQLNIRLR